MRNLRFLVILVLIIFAISLIQKGGLGSRQNQKKNIMTPTSTPASNAADATQTPTPTPTLIQAPSPTLVPPTSTQAPSSQKNIRSFIYPGSTILNQSGDQITLQSTDDPQVITNWYKEKIISLNMKAKSFVTTNTNGNILNKLVGAGAGFKVKIQIEKSNASSTTTINISLE